MGQCLSSIRSTDPKQHDEVANFEIGQRYGTRAPSPTLDRSIQLTGRVDFGREESRLKELFAALRTGLVFTPTEFSVLPAITTTAKVIFSVGSSTLQSQEDLAEESEREEETESDGEGEETNSQNDEDESVKEKVNKKEEDYELRVTFYGSAWTKGLSMQLAVWPVVGPFANRKLVFRWGEDLLRVQGCMKGEMNARALPVSFETETEFCKCCLLLAHHSDSTANLHMEDDDDLEPEKCSNKGKVSVLSALAYRVAVSNLDAISESINIPGKIQNHLYGSQAPVTISVRMWPSTYSSQSGTNPVMKVKSGIVCSEFAYLLKEHFHLPPNNIVKLYHNYKPLQLNTVVTSKYKSVDCFVIIYDNDSLNGNDDYSSEVDEADSESETATLVISLVGYDVQNVEASLEMRLKDFDRLLRRKFQLGNESFLIILAEDDHDPQYASSNDWKCIYPFSLPDNSFTAGLRRSIRKLSSMRRSSNPNSPTQRTTPRRLSSEESAVFTPQTAKVIEVLSSSARHFPCLGETFGLTVEELYESMPMYQMSLEQCGIHPYSIIQVFEVTGPSIPITFRVLADRRKTTPQSPKTPNAPRTRLANIMDINPSWSIHTFLQYVDAIISPASGIRQKRLTLKGRSIEDSEDLSTLTLGALLDLWKPVWWPLKGTKRKQLSIRDIDPSEFLLVEKH